MWFDARARLHEITKAPPATIATIATREAKIEARPPATIATIATREANSPAVSQMSQMSQPIQAKKTAFHVADVADVATPLAEKTAPGAADVADVADVATPLTLKTAWEEIDRLPLLAEDREFIRERINRRPDAAALLARYLIVWRAAADGEPVEFRKANRGRYAANTWLRSATEQRRGRQ